MEWTPKQEKIIDNRDSSVLVSAAAGSGKTAVLVERIINKVLDKANPKNIDEFLVVTFTNAAANQMREKIAAKLEEALIREPENEHIARQLVLVNRADITTIDGFCLRIVKEHFSLLGIDSTVNIGDKGMLDLIKSDVMDELFSEKYSEYKETSEKEKDDNPFYDLVDIFWGFSEDDDLKKQILRIYNIASSYPIPEKWFSEAKESLLVETVGEFEALPWVKAFISVTKKNLESALIYVEKGKNACSLPGGPDKNYSICCEDEELIKSMLKAHSYSEMRTAINETFPRLKSCKGDGYDMELVEEYKEIRNKYKEIVKSVKLYDMPAEDVVEQIRGISKILIPLIELTEDFANRYKEAKQTKKLMEFSDVEHLAYELCCDGYSEDGCVIPTKAGKKIAERYDEIYIDEYQDSNYLQEDILTSVSGIPYGRYNMFMVGDVKQSIYKFRMARPDLFVRKYESFGEEGNQIKIELKDNFRSRDVVLHPVNYFFYQLMGKDLGGIEYNSDIALVPSKDFPEPPEGVETRISNNTELLFVKGNANEDGIADSNLSDEELNYEKLEVEAKLICSRIKELTNPYSGQYVYDEELNTYRLAEYRDIVILARSIKGFGDIVYNELNECGIPVYIEDSKGYFEATEIKLIMSLLAVVDNSRQDIPLSAVLMSPMGNLLENEVAVICDYANKVMDKNAYLYDKCELYIEEFDDDIARKLRDIFEIISSLKAMKKNISISNLIWEALNMTGYYTYAASMPMGNKRKSNINMLIEKARKYEDGYYKGLFNFLRYVDKMKVNDVDFGEANILSDDENVIRILSMHKSKGLEYPIVFVSGLGKQFNEMDIKASIIVHNDYYLSSLDFNKKQRYKKDTFIINCFKQLIREESVAEELRILYVAMTRAKEKLILTGCSNEIDKMIEDSCDIKDVESYLLPYVERNNPKSFLKLIVMAMARYDILSKKLMPEKLKDSISLKIYSYEEIVARKIKADLDSRLNAKNIRQMLDEGVATVNSDEVKAHFEYEYPYELFTNIKSKMSVSEIKKMKAFDGTGFDVAEDESKPQPEVSDKKEGLKGAERGTIIHKFMELLDFSKADENEDYITGFLGGLVNDGTFSVEESEVINISKIKKMLDSSLGNRMKQADTNGLLFKEQQFSAGVKACEIYPELSGSDADDVVVVQGIIDAFFYDGDDIVVMDYKTDRATADELIGRYKAQLDYYASILSRLTGKNVKEKIIYSFYLDNEIQL